LARNEYGEVELVLGTKQLIGVFLVVVILLGLFASMGYIIGISSSPRGVETTKAAPAKPIVVPKPTDQDGAAPAASEENKDEPASSDSKPSPAASPLPAPTKVVEAPKPKPSPVDQSADTKPKPVEKPVAKPAEKPAETARLAISDPPAGQYWQVMAAERADAELIAEELSKKGLKTLLAPAPKSGYYRVLVGPFADAARMADIRTDLEKAGFKQPIVRKY